METTTQLTDAQAGGLFAGLGFIWLIEMVFIVLFLVAMWKIYTKAGKPGWAAIIPFYNIYVQMEIVGRPGWWLVLYFIPIVNIVVYVIVTLDLAKSFGRGFGYALGLIVFPGLWHLHLGFGSDQYKGQGALMG